MNIETETGTNWEWETKQRSENIQKKIQKLQRMANRKTKVGICQMDRNL